MNLAGLPSSELKGASAMAQAARGMNAETLAALEAIEREHPGWHITFQGGYRARWFAWRVFEAPATLVSVECFSARVLRGRLLANDWVVTPRDCLEMNSGL
jgi:hypothetical protein